MTRKIIITAAILGLLGVVAGAFGAHGLNAALTTEQKEVWHTAVQYQFYHVFALLFLSVFAGDVKLTRASYYLFTFGIIFFSGSLYLFACADLLKITLPTLFGLVTPLGGLLFIGGWAMLALAAIRSK